MMSSIGRNPSYLWRSLCWGRDVIRSGCIWRVGDGTAINIYKDPWLPNEGPLKVLTPPTDPSIVKVADLFTTSGAWNMSLIQSLLSPHEASLIKNLSIGGRFKADRLAWHHHQSGNYNVKSGYWVAWRIDGGSSLGSSSIPEVQQWWQSIWKLSIPKKIQIFLWRACNGALPTYAALAARKIKLDNVCDICGSQTESVLHALWTCKYAKPIWKAEGFYKLLKTSGFTSFTDLCCWALKNLPSFEGDRFALLAWAIWNRRNAIVHGHSPKADTVLLNGVAQLQIEFYEALANLKSECTIPPISKSHICWKLPESGMVKVNVDGGIGNDKVGVGVIIRNEVGAVMAALAKPVCQQLSPLATELLAIKEALIFCQEAGFASGVLESDSLQAIGLIEGSDICLDSNCFVIEDIRSLLSSLAFKCNFVRRDANKVAHKLAKFSLSLDHFQVWLEEVPSWLSKVVQEDFCNASVI